MNRSKELEEFLAKHPNVKLNSDTGAKKAAPKTPAKPKAEKKRKTLSEIEYYIPPINFEVRREPVEKGGRKGIKITLPFPPPTNNLYYTQKQPNGSEMRFKSYRYKKYYEILHGSKKKRGILQDVPKHVLKGDLIIKLKVYRPKNTGDWDGYIKAPQDVLKGWFFDDDKQIIRGEVDKLLDRDRPRVEIVLYEANAPDKLF